MTAAPACPKIHLLKSKAIAFKKMEPVMSHCIVSASANCSASSRVASGTLAEGLGSKLGFARLRSTIAIWRRRANFRWDLEQKSRDNPHLMADIGLTVCQVEAELAKHFWQA